MKKLPMQAPLTTSQKIDRIRENVRTLYSHLDEAVGVKVLCDCGNAPEIENTFEGKHQESRVLILIRNALFERLMMTLMRAHDRPWPDRASLPQIISLLSEPAIQNQIGNNTSQWNVSINDVIQKHWPSLNHNCSTGLKVLRDYRNHRIAHNLTLQDLTLPIFDDLFRLLEETEKIVENLASALDMVHISYDSLRKAWEDIAKSYWKMILRGASGIS